MTVNRIEADPHAFKGFHEMNGSVILKDSKRISPFGGDALCDGFSIMLINGRCAAR